MVSTRASHRRDIYSKDEIAKLKDIKELYPKANWKNVSVLFNENMLEDRWRTEDALKGKWKAMENEKKNIKILYELKDKYHQSDWQEILEYFNESVPHFRRKSTITQIKLIWDRREQEKNTPIDQNSLQGAVYNFSWDTQPNIDAISGEMYSPDPTPICDTCVEQNSEQLDSTPQSQTNSPNNTEMDIYSQVLHESNQLYLDSLNDLEHSGYNEIDWE
ncbi:hypothetical protein FQN57_003635 [Myotisia sp. PD_48]|nr:hypothetical protein FQN57_003635 [Myotisia sp. PD_48]